ARSFGLEEVVPRKYRQLTPQRPDRLRVRAHRFGQFLQLGTFRLEQTMQPLVAERPLQQEATLGGGGVEVQRVLQRQDVFRLDLVGVEVDGLVGADAAARARRLRVQREN